MSETKTSSHRRLLLVDGVHGSGVVLERALSVRGWTVLRTDSSSVPSTLSDTDVVLLSLDGDDADGFELLLRLSSLPQRPTVVLMTRRSDARVLGREVLASLGVDRIASWPARVEDIAAALEAAQHEHVHERIVS